MCIILFASVSYQQRKANEINKTNQLKAILISFLFFIHITVNANILLAPKQTNEKKKIKMILRKKKNQLLNYYFHILTKLIDTKRNEIKGKKTKI